MDTEVELKNADEKTQKAAAARDAAKLKLDTYISETTEEVRIRVRIRVRKS